jgi:EpsI family protein
VGPSKDMRIDAGSWIRFVLVAALLLGAGGFLRSRGQAEVAPQRKPLDSFPKEIGGWDDVKDLSISDDTREVLGDGEFLSRVYSRKPGEPYVDLFLAYFPSQRTGNTMHSPQNCLPGAGWSMSGHRHIQITGPNGPLAVNLYIISKGTDRQIVLYWYQAHGRVVASEYWAKVYLVTDAISMNRTDGSLVRVITPASTDESEESAMRRALDFAEHMLPDLDQYIPR